MTARNHFINHGYDVYRPAFYWDGPDTRKLDECTVEIHAQDLSKVIDLTKAKHEKVYCAGHSYGGLTLLHSNPEINAVSFWDSSYIPSWLEDELETIDNSKHYSLPWGTRQLVGKDMLEEAISLTAPVCKDLAENFISPSQVILAEDAQEEAIRKNLYIDLKATKELIEIDGADHCFYKKDSMIQLLQHTENWFSSHS